MKKLLPVMLFAATNLQAQQSCPIVTASTMVQSTINTNLWKLMISFNSVTNNSIQYRIAAGGNVFTGCLDSLSGYWSIETQTFDCGVFQPVLSVTPFSGTGCTGAQCGVLLASSPEIRYANGLIHFTGDLYYSGKVVTKTSPYKPQWIGEYLCYDHSWSKTVYVSAVDRPTSFRVIDKIGRFMGTVKVPANSTIRKDARYYYVPVR